MKFLFLFSLFLFQLFAKESIIIRTPVGNIRGKESNGHRSFIGIPFAEKPQRWRAPVAKKQFTSVFNATQFGFICPQTRQWDPNFYPKQDEDCLNLNIWTPSHLKRNEKLPVVIYLYGGAFDFGISSRRNYRGNFIANSTNSIFVSLNYRVGSLGWLDGLDQNGNYGLMDQRLALEWIHKNIEFFGGDNKKITLIGQSAGAMSVLMHLISPRTNENLFQKVVFLGAPFSILYRNRDQNQPYMKMFAANLGCVLNDRKCYEAQPLAEIVKASSRTALIPTPPLLNSRNVLPWTPTIDGLDVPGQPLRLIREGKYKKNVQVIIGYNRDEAADFLLKAYDRPIPHWQYKTLATIWMGFHTPEFLRMYPPRHEDARYTAIEMGSDYFFYCSGLALTKELTSQNVSTHVYLFNHSPMVDVPNSFPACSNNNSCHSAELSFMWGTYRYYPESNRNENERNLSTEMMNTIASFAHNKPISLPKYELKKDEIWGFAPTASKVLKDYRSKECKMWDRIGGYFNQ